MGLSLAAGDPAAPAEAVELLDGGAQAYPRMLAAIARARRHIHLESYAFAASGIGARFIEALSQAAQRRIAVRVVIDGWGSARHGRAIAAELRAAGCQVEIYNRLRSLLLGRFGRNHRKMLLVDDEVAFFGGMNIGDVYAADAERLGWADLALEIRGPQCANLGRRLRREPRQAMDSALKIDLSALGGGWRLRRRYLKAFAGARLRILLAHGYFLPDRGLVRAITAAARRGVEVRLLLAGKSDVPFARVATRSLYRRLLRAGVVIHEWSASVLHAKVTAVDGRLLLIGSFNLDPLSLANLEALVEVATPRVVAEGEAWIQDHLRRSTAVTSLDRGRRLDRWVLERFGLVAARLAHGIGRLIAGGRRGGLKE